MALSNPQKGISQLADASGNPIIGAQQTTVAELTDSTTGTAGDTVDDSTASVKDDIASLAAKINAIFLIADA
jgi:hypothetical protein